MSHYDGKEFEKILLEAQANMMKGIPSIEAEESPALPLAATGEQAHIQNLVDSPSTGTTLALTYYTGTFYTFYYTGSKLFLHNLNDLYDRRAPV